MPSLILSQLTRCISVSLWASLNHFLYVAPLSLTVRRYGLSYTTFARSNFNATSATFSSGDIITFHVDVTNIGKYAGSDVVRMQIALLLRYVAKVPNLPGLPPRPSLDHRAPAKAACRLRASVSGARGDSSSGDSARGEQRYELPYFETAAMALRMWACVGVHRHLPMCPHKEGFVVTVVEAAALLRHFSRTWWPVDRAYSPCFSF